MSNYLLNQSPFFKQGVVPSTFSDIFENLFSFDKESELSSVPLCNIEWEEDQVIVTAELPGVQKEDLSITVDQKNLSIKGERKIPEIEGKSLLQERYTGSYERTISLPYLIEDGGVEAVLKNGVLTIILKRKEDSKPKSIEVKIN
ncbi:MAG: hypothetical protein COA79_08365 [Planctomycetota bacterium]|nr:MAG: hypothetical protein COA79_08365 [Planctomycetota bacterium]